jgi:hypothetical protein
MFIGQKVLRSSNRSVSYGEVHKYRFFSMLAAYPTFFFLSSIVLLSISVGNFYAKTLKISDIWSQDIMLLPSELAVKCQKLISCLVKVLGVREFKPKREFLFSFLYLLKGR